MPGLTLMTIWGGLGYAILIYAAAIQTLPQGLYEAADMDGAGPDETGAQQKFLQRRGYTIPYSCFVPLKVEGLLIAGRCISGTHMAHSSYRVMPICANMGQAVGLAAATGTLPRALEAADIQKVMRELGVDPEKTIQVARKEKASFGGREGRFPAA